MKACFSPTLMTHFKQSYVTIKMRLYLPYHGFNLMFFSLNHIRGLFSSPTYHSFLNFLSLSNSVPLHLFKSIKKKKDKSREVILYLAELYKDYIIWSYVAIFNTCYSLEFSPVLEFYHACSLACSQESTLSFSPSSAGNTSQFTENMYKLKHCH